MLAGSEWQDEDLVFAQANGRPIDKKTDYDDWTRLLQRAGVRHVRLHDGRHTAATLLLSEGLYGWSWSCSATAGCARRWTSTATSCRRWPGRQPTAWARCCSQVRVGGLQLQLQLQLQPETTQAALPRGNGLVNGVELRNW